MLHSVSRIMSSIAVRIETVRLTSNTPGIRSLFITRRVSQQNSLLFGRPNEERLIIDYGVTYRPCEFSACRAALARAARHFKALNARTLRAPATSQGRAARTRI